MSTPRPPGSGSSGAGLSRDLGNLLILAGLAPALLGFSLLSGLVLRRSPVPAEALLIAGALVILPVLGLWFLLGRSRVAAGLALGTWGLALLVGSPSLFPGERSLGIGEGFSWLASPFGATASPTAAEWGRKIGSALDARLTADEPWIAPTPVAAEPLQELSTARASLAQLPPVGGLILPYEGYGDSLKVGVTLDGPEFSEDVSLLFDTGATLTTIARDVLAELAIPIPPDAPTARFQTANGEVESPLILLERVWLSDKIAVEGVTAAVCDDCTREGGAGLLGLNVSGLFQTTVDPEVQTITLKPRRNAPDRRLDIAHWLHIEASATTWPSGRVVVNVAATNRSERDIHAASVSVECPDSMFSIDLGAIRRRSLGSTEVELPSDAVCPTYLVKLQSARW